MSRKKAPSRLLTDAVREVRNTRSRFLSLLVLSALAVCFLAGLRATAPDMKETGDLYFDQQRLMDLRGVSTLGLTEEDLEALERGLPNLLRHVENMTQVYGLPTVVAINRFPTDSAAELDLIRDRCRNLGVRVALSEVYEKGGQGGLQLAEEVVSLCDSGEGRFTFAYDSDQTIQEKLDAIVRKVYRGSRAVLTPEAQRQAAHLTELGFGGCPVCIAKTPYSFSDDQALLGAPSGFQVTVRNIKVSAGAGFLVALAGNVLTMPGLPKAPCGQQIDLDNNGTITGLS